MNEHEFLDQAVSTYRTTDHPQERTMRDLVLRTFAPYFQGGLGLELGCCDGYLTEKIAARVDRLDVVDGARSFLDALAARGLANVRCHYGLFEEHASEERYDWIFASYILEHVDEPQAVLAMARRHLKPQGRLFIVVPNARALSRQLARHMGLLKTLHELTPNDINHGHRRVYDRSALSAELAQAGFSEIAQGGILLKPFADFQMDQLMQGGVVGPTQIEGLYKLGLEHPDLAGSLFSVCAPTTSGGA